MESFRIPDLNGPRYRKAQQEVCSDEFYKALCKKFPKVETLGRTVVAKYIKEFNELTTQAIIDNRDGVELLESLGNIFIANCRVPEKENVDYAKSKKYGVKVLHKNWDTEGRIGKIMYTNYGAKYRLKDSSMWIFKPCRKFSRESSKAFRLNWMNYMEITKNEKISALISRHVAKKDHLKKSTAEGIIEYNEFDLNS
jgi:hypothetical protein